MRVFIAGATGVLGRVLIPTLLASGHTVRALARSGPPPDTAAIPGLKWVVGDLLADQTVERLPELLAGCRAVVHAATVMPRHPAAPGAWDLMARLRTEGTRHLLGAALAAGADRYVQQSISMAYPDGGDRWLDELVPLDTSPERATICGPVIRMEALVRAVPAERLEWTILRGGRFVGPGTTQDALLAQLRQGRLVVPGTGRNYLSPVHVADMAAAIAAALAAPPGSIYNVVDEPIRYGAYVDQLADLLGVRRPIRDPGATPDPSWRCSSAAIRRDLGWVPRDGMARELA